MSKGYWVCAYRKVNDPETLKAYSALATPVITDAGGRFVVRGMADEVHQEGIKERIVVVEFESLAKAVATYESDAYKAALAVLGDAVERDFRIVHGAE